MCCFFVLLIGLGPRIAGVFWWLLEPARWSLAFDSVIWPILGIIFVPWTTLMYLIVFPGGLSGLDFLWMGLGVLADVVSYSSSAAKRRDVKYYPGNLP